MKLNFFKSAFTLAEVPEARQHIRHWSNASSHCEERSDVAIAKPIKRYDLAITTQTASARNDSKHNPLPLGEGGTQCRVRVKKAAFTLAEVLITLAIIGIVAALTIPTLVQNFQSRAWDTASEVFQRKLEESLKVMNVQGTLAGYTTTEAFVDELSKHIKITRICDNDEITSCFADKVYWGKEGEEPEEVDMSEIKTAKHFGQEDWDTNTVAVQFANGVNAVIAYNPDCTQNQFSNQVTGENCLAILYDVDGFKNPNTVLKDLRNNGNIISLGGVEGGFCIPDGLCFTAPFKPTALTAADCNANKEKYGIQNCMTGDNDYWGGAMKACAEQGKRLPSDNELTMLANDLYNTTVNGGDSQGFEADLDMDKANKYGIPLYESSGGGFSTIILWGNWEVNESRASVREFSSDSTTWHSFGNRFYSGPQFWAVCVGE